MMSGSRAGKPDSESSNRIQIATSCVEHREYTLGSLSRTHDAGMSWVAIGVAPFVAR